MTTSAIEGWGFPYAEWPDNLKAKDDYNPATAEQFLADVVYPHGIKTNIVTEGTENLALLKIIKDYFAAVGIDMEIRAMDSADWVAFCRTSRKYDQMVNRHGAGALGMVSEPLNHLERFGLVSRQITRWSTTRFSSLSIIGRFPSPVSMNSGKSSEMPMNMLPGSISRYP